MLICWIFLLLVLEYGDGVKIVKMRVPEVVQLGTKDAVTLDCEYVTDNVTGLVVKWFFNDKSQPVYQWIPPKKPQALGILKDKLDLNYKVSQNVYTEHRALRILHPGVELSGDFTCVVSTFLSEDEKSKPLTIFVPEKKFYLIQDRLDDEYLNIICAAEGVHPRPNLTLSAGNRHLLSAKTSVTCTSGRYSAVTSAMLRLDSLPERLDLMCELLVPKANYLSRKRDVYYRNPPTTTISPSPMDSEASPDSARLTEPTLITLVITCICLMVFHPS